MMGTSGFSIAVASAGGTLPRKPPKPALSEVEGTALRKSRRLLDNANKTSTFRYQNSHRASADIDDACAVRVFGVFVAVVYDRDAARESGGVEPDSG
jgi:hypothetical protein